MVSTYLLIGLAYEFGICSEEGVPHSLSKVGGEVWTFHQVLVKVGGAVRSGGRASVAVVHRVETGGLCRLELLKLYIVGDKKIEFI